MPLVGRRVSIGLLKARLALEDGREPGLAMRAAMSLRPGRVRVFANIEAAPEVDLQFGRPGLRVGARPSAPTHEIGRYRVTAADADRGTVGTRAGGETLTRDWTGDVTGVREIIADLERARGLHGPRPREPWTQDGPRPPMPDRPGPGGGDRPRLMRLEPPRRPPGRGPRGRFEDAERECPGRERTPTG